MPYERGKRPPTLQFAESGEVEADQAGIDELLRLLGYPEAAVSDESIFLDFLSLIEYPTKALAQQELDRLLPIRGIDVGHTLLQGLYEIRKSLPGWPTPRLQ